MGLVDDYKFACSLRACEVAVFPYLEVGQSASGPVAQAIELKVPTILSFNHTFIEYGKYYPNHFEFFDIGNYLQLADIIKAGIKKCADLPYDGQTQAEHYLQIISQLLKGTAEHDRLVSRPSSSENQLVSDQSRSTSSKDPAPPVPTHSPLVQPARS